MGCHVKAVHGLQVIRQCVVSWALLHSRECDGICSMFNIITSFINLFLILMSYSTRFLEGLGYRYGVEGFRKGPLRVEPLEIYTLYA